MTPGWSMSRHHHRRHHPCTTTTTTTIGKKTHLIKKVPPIEIAKQVQLLVRTFVQCAAKYAGPRKDYESIASAISRLGPTYMKFARAAASRGTSSEPEMAGALGQLQDDMARFSDQSAIDTIRKESPKLYEDIENIEDMLEKGSVAAASLCQVYKCRLKETREDVAVKVQRPNIREQVEADAYLLRLAASYLEKFNLVEAKAVDAVDEFVSRLFEEMDFENEAENVKKFNSLYGPKGTAKMDDVVNGAAGNSDNNGRKSKLEIRVPKVYEEYTSKKVLVLEWIEGTPLASRERAKSIERFTVGKVRNRVYVESTHRNRRHACGPSRGEFNQTPPITAG